MIMYNTIIRYNNFVLLQTPTFHSVKTSTRENVNEKKCTKRFTFEIEKLSLSKAEN
jgi:hypothetical protein